MRKIELKPEIPGNLDAESHQVRKVDAHIAGGPEFLLREGKEDEGELSPLRVRLEHQGGCVDGAAVRTHEHLAELEHIHETLLGSGLGDTLFVEQHVHELLARLNLLECLRRLEGALSHELLLGMVPLRLCVSRDQHLRSLKHCHFLVDHFEFAYVIIVFPDSAMILVEKL